MPTPHTQCPECRHTLTADPAQLRANGGWLRCNHCGHHFQPRAPGDAATGGSGSLHLEPHDPILDARALADADRLRIDLNDEPRLELWSGGTGAALSIGPGLPAGRDAMAADQRPSFVVGARYRAFWQAPAVRGLLWLVLLVLALGGLAQYATTQRDLLAARYPALKPWLQVLCKPLRCQVLPYRDLGSIALDGSDFSHQQDSHYAFSASLHNRAWFPIATPQLELTLSDGSRQVLVRRHLTPAQLQLPEALPAGQELNFSRLLVLSGDAAAQPVSNYEVKLSYP